MKHFLLLMLSLLLINSAKADICDDDLSTLDYNTIITEFKTADYNCASKIIVDLYTNRTNEVSLLNDLLTMASNFASADTARANAVWALGTFYGLESTESAHLLVKNNYSLVLNTVNTVIMDDTKENPIDYALWVVDSYMNFEDSIETRIEELAFRADFSSRFRFRVMQRWYQYKIEKDTELTAQDMDWLADALVHEDEWVRAQAAYNIASLEQSKDLINNALFDTLRPILLDKYNTDSNRDVVAYSAWALDVFDGSNYWNEYKNTFVNTYLTTYYEKDFVKIYAGLPYDQLEHFADIMIELNEFYSEFMGSEFQTPADAGETNEIALYLFPNQETYNFYMSSYIGSGANNGGLYIEQNSTLYTYQRDAVTAGLSVEELIKHEFGHYLNNKYIFKGLWNDWGAYDGVDMGFHTEQKGWADEGLAEFMAGLETGHQNVYESYPREGMYKTYYCNTRNSLADLINRKVGYDDFSGYWDYEGGYSFMYFMVNEHKDMLLDILKKFRDSGKFGSYQTEQFESYIQPYGYTIATLEAEWHAKMDEWCNGEYLVADISINKEFLKTGNKVTYTDNSDPSTGNSITSWEWKFEGGIPENFSGQNPPEILYAEEGIFSATLSVTDNLGNTASKLLTNAINVTANDVVMHNGSETVCDAFFYDPGWKNDYALDGAYVLTLYPETGQMLSVEFLDFLVEDIGAEGDIYDYLSIYDGTSIDAGLIGQYYGSNNPGVVTATNAEGALTFKFVSDKEGIVRSGWKARASCTPAAPFADFISSTLKTTVNESVNFTDISKNSPSSYYWEFEGGTPSTSTEVNPVISYTNPGTYEVKLTVSNTTGSNTVVKTDFITISELALPIADFEASNLKISLGDVIDFNDLSAPNATSWNWTFEGGTPETSTEQYPRIIYNEEGDFDVSLTVTNALGSTTEVKTAHITVVNDLVSEYCQDAKSASSFEIYYPITNVSLGDINNSSSHSTEGYSDYTNLSTTLIPNNSYDLSVSIQDSYEYMNVTAWIDWNQNNIFDTDEVVAQFDPSNPAEYNLNFTVPQSATIGTTVMRVRTNYNTYGYASPCGSSSYISETEDYSIVVSNGSTVLLPPIAEFIADNTSIALNDDVTFTNVTERNADTYYWEFEGGSPSISYTENPVVTYSEPGAYSVKLIARNNAGNDIVEKSDYITVNASTNTPIAAFSSSEQVISVGTTVTFDNTSLYGESYNWTFTGGDISNSTEEMPSVTYNQKGKYSVNLVVGNIQGTDTRTRTEYINVVDFPTAAFTANSLVAFVGDTITLQSQSIDASSQKWFIPGAYTTEASLYEESVLENPKIIYSQPGSYMVRLTAFSQFGEDELTRNNFVQIYSNDDLVVDFDADILEAGINEEITFSDLSTSNIGSITAYEWKFSGPQEFTSYSEQPKVRFTTSGLYQVSLKVTTANGLHKTLTKTDFINITGLPAPFANFNSDNTEITVGDTVNFYDLSTNTTNWSWTFEGGTPAVSSAQNPVVTYNEEGIYEVSLTASNASGSSTEVKTAYIVVESRIASDHCKDATSPASFEIYYPITNVSLGDINNTTSHSSLGYGDYTGISTTLIPNNTYDLSVTVQDNYEFLNVIAWIDWNLNSVFDANEVVAQFDPSNPAVYSINFTVPANAVLGTTVLRIRTNYKGYGFASPCGASSYISETEDYGIVISNSSAMRVSNTTESLTPNSVDLSDILVVYPNPIADFMNINSNGLLTSDARFKIVNLDAKVLKTGIIRQANKVTRVDVSNLSSGVYFILIETGDHQYYSEKLIKK
ncbi:PKD domain-containing protein [Sediminitomix flava]|nr:PKD domain-containing protein [Sediminitomix flava]